MKVAMGVVIVLLVILVIMTLFPGIPGSLRFEMKRAAASGQRQEAVKQIKQELDKEGFTNKDIDDAFYGNNPELKEKILARIEEIMGFDSEVIDRVLVFSDLCGEARLDMIDEEAKLKENGTLK